MTVQWTTACPDWERRILARESLIPSPPLFPDQAQAALAVMDQLRVVDQPGSPTWGELSRPWLRDFVSNIFGAYEPESGRRLIREWLLLISGRKVINRTAALLAILARRMRPKSHNKAIPVHLPLRRQELAHYLGTTPESLSRSFHELANRGILQIIDPQHFAILDLGALIDISGHDLVVDDDR